MISISGIWYWFDVLCFVIYLCYECVEVPEIVIDLSVLSGEISGNGAIFKRFFSKLSLFFHGWF